MTSLCYIFNSEGSHYLREEKKKKKTFHLVSKPTVWKKYLNFKIALWDSANVVGHSIPWIQNIHLLCNKGLHTAYCSLKCLHRPHEGATMWPYFFEQLQSAVGELESAEQGEAMPFLAESTKTHGRMNSSRSFRKWEEEQTKTVQQSSKTVWLHTW